MASFHWLQTQLRGLHPFLESVRLHFPTLFEIYIFFNDAINFEQRFMLNEHSFFRYQ